MDVRVRLRINKVTGEVEQFEVDDVGTMRLPEAEHNRQHDRIAADLGNVLERNSHVFEVFPGAVPATPVVPEPEPEPEPTPEPERLSSDSSDEGGGRK